MAKCAESKIPVSVRMLNECISDNIQKIRWKFDLELCVQ